MKNPPTLHLSKHTGMLIAFSMQPFKSQGDPEKLRAAYRQIQIHCLLFGWWSLFSFFIVNPATILLNAFNWWQYKKKYAQYLQAIGAPTSPIKA